MAGNELAIHIIANAAGGAMADPQGLSGGDRIFIECARRWASRGNQVVIYTWEGGLRLCQRNKLAGVNYVVWPVARYREFGFATMYLAKVLKGCSEATKVDLVDDAIVYSSSDFWPDVLPAIVMRLRNRRVRWVAGFYMFAPNPLRGFRTQGSFQFPSRNGLFYFFSQRLAFALIRRYADMVFVTSEPDVAPFVTGFRSKEKVVVVRGGVDIRAAGHYLTSNRQVEKEYDACFVGRFHPQKGVLELVEIWEQVTRQRPQARLAMIGVGPLEEQVAQIVRQKQLTQRIDLLGFRDGPEKYEIFKKSRLILHPALYDSGGMAACEGMAWGLPAVGFDLPALKTYYPRGMLKAPIGDLRAFAELILRLLEDQTVYEKTRQDARSWAQEWDWDKRAEDILSKIKSCTK